MARETKPDAHWFRQLVRGSEPESRSQNQLAGSPDSSGCQRHPYTRKPQTGRTRGKTRQRIRLDPGAAKTQRRDGIHRRPDRDEVVGAQDVNCEMDVVRCPMYLLRLPNHQMGNRLSKSFGNLVVETST